MVSRRHGPTVGGVRSMGSSPNAERVTGSVISSPAEESPHRRRWIVIGVAVVVIAAGAVAVTDHVGRSTPSGVAAFDNADPTSHFTVTRHNLSSKTELNASLGYAGNYSVVNQAAGTVTALPDVGQAISNGQVLYDVNGAPVALLYGSTPAYRDLSESSSATAVTGPDVAELNADLVALGYVSAVEIPANTDAFTYWTKVGVEHLQAILGVTVNGTLALGQAVFLPTASRITALGTSTVLGGAAQPGSTILSATSTSRVVTIDLDADQQSEVAVGDQASITLPNNQTTPGVISSVGTVATARPSGSAASGTTPTITVVVTPTDPSATGIGDQEPVVVSVTTARVKDALVVPVDSLLALNGGGYAVEAVSSASVHSLVPVTLGLFDDADGLVQVVGSGLSTGQRVVVPAL
jgi:hypothetical protein